MRTLRIFMVCTLVMCSVFSMQMYEKTCFIGTVDASGDNENVTWGMLNQTVDDLKNWFISVLNNFETNMSTEISDATDTVLSYIANRLNLSDVINISLIWEGINEIHILNRLAAIEGALGYNNETTATVYQDLLTIILGLVDAEGRYILRNATGVSSFFFVGLNQVELGKNQCMLVQKIETEHNATRTAVETESTDIKEKISSTGAMVAEKSGGDGFYSMLAGIGVLFLILWILWLRRWINEHYGYPVGLEQPPPPFQPEDKPGITESEPVPMTDTSQFTKNPFRWNPIKKGVGHLECYRDGITFDPMVQMICNTCPDAEDCNREKIEHDATLEIQREELKPKDTAATPGFDQGISDGVIKPSPDLSSW